MLRTLGQRADSARWAIAHTITLGLLVVVGATASGCTREAPPSISRSGVETDNGAADAMVVSASKATRQTLGIDKWQLYRAKGGVYLTGVDANDKPVKGIATVFTRTDDGDIDSVFARVGVKNGSSYVATHSMLKNETAASADLKSDSRALVRRAVLDLSQLNAGLRVQDTSGLTPVARARTECGQQLSGAMLQALACLDASPDNSKAAALCSGLARLVDASGISCAVRGKTTALQSLVAGVDAVTRATCGNDIVCQTQIAMTRRENALDLACRGNLGCVQSRSGFLPFVGSQFAPSRFRGFSGRSFSAVRPRGRRIQGTRGSSRFTPRRDSIPFRNGGPFGKPLNLPMRRTSGTNNTQRSSGPDDIDGALDVCRQSPQDCDLADNRDDVDGALDFCRTSPEDCDFADNRGNTRDDTDDLAGALDVCKSSPSDCDLNNEDDTAGALDVCRTQPEDCETDSEQEGQQEDDEDPCAQDPDACDDSEEQPRDIDDFEGNAD